EVTPVEQSNRGLGLHLRRRFGQLFACPACDGRRHDRFAHLCRPAKRANYKARLRLRVKNRAALKPTFKFMAAHATQGKSDHNANPARSLSSLPLRSSSYSSSQSPICILSKKTCGTVFRPCALAVIVWRALGSSSTAISENARFFLRNSALARRQ